jgi:hypothetical protein
LARSSVGVQRRRDDRVLASDLLATGEQSVRGSRVIGDGDVVELAGQRGVQLDQWFDRVAVLGNHYLDGSEAGGHARPQWPQPAERREGGTGEVQTRYLAGGPGDHPYAAVDSTELQVQRSPVTDATLGDKRGGKVPFPRHRADQIGQLLLHTGDLGDPGVGRSRTRLVHDPQYARDKSDDSRHQQDCSQLDHHRPVAPVPP